MNQLLPTLSKKRRVRHHPALPYDQIGEFITALRAQESIAALALEFTILTAARTNEVIAAGPDEIDTDKAVWTIPASRMKAGKEHRVPLSYRAVSIAQRMLELKGTYLFPSSKADEHLSNMAMLAVLGRMNRRDITVHGFRSTFRDWASEHTNFAHEVCEMALAHTIANEAEAAYRRGDLFEKRRRLMEAWAEFIEIEKPIAKSSIIPLRQMA